jgi:thiol-disulfide isomerase/thioredoxin
MFRSVFAVALLPLVAVPAGAAEAKPDPRWPFRSVGAVVEKPQGGVGLVLEVKDGGVAVQQAVAGGPAQRAGMKAGDVLATVDGWPVPHGSQVPDVAQHIRGTPGTRVRLGIRRPGEATELELEVERAPMDRMFATTAKEVVRLKKGLALLATSARGQIGVQFDGDGKAGEVLRYHWRVAGNDQPLAAASDSGEGMLVADAKDGAVVQVAELRLDLKVLPDGATIVSGANLPLHDPGTGDWLTVKPPYPSVFKPRSSPPKKATYWTGDAKLRWKVEVEGVPLANRRLTLTLIDEHGTSDATRTATTDKQGLATFQVPPGKYQVRSVEPSQSGGERDAWFEAAVGPDQQSLSYGTGVAGLPAAAAEVPALRLVKRGPLPNVGPKVDDWQKDEHVGRGVPLLDVKKWHGWSGAQPKDLKGKALALYVWATWCGPCRVTAPNVAELHARLAGKGVAVVEASIDRDEGALDEYLQQNALPGGPPVAWVGPDAMEALDISGVPTLFLIDGSGTIAAVATGSGWSVDEVEKVALGLVPPVGKKGK